MTVSFTFKKEEKLCSKKLISRLFAGGNSFNIYPFRIIWLEVDEALPCRSKTAVSVSKKKFRRAVDRNRIKRQVKESWRLNKNELNNYLEQKNKNLVLMIIYTGKQGHDFNSITSATQKVITKLLLLLSD